ncbi:hypothetical protein OXX80_005912 [Metschnikowia pulcherrima]
MFHEHIPPPGSNTRGAVPSNSSHSPLNPADHRSLLHSVTSPTQSYSHDPALHNDESAPAMSAASSNISDTSHGANKRPVARRACLSCREKKIKCDGEMISMDPQEPQPVCSNCKFLGTECVFVRSMRGGRRRRRADPPSPCQNPGFMKKAREILDQSTSQFAGQRPPSGPLQIPHFQPSQAETLPVNTAANHMPIPEPGKLKSSTTSASTHPAPWEPPLVADLHPPSFMKLKLPSPTLSHSTSSFSRDSVSGVSSTISMDQDMPKRGHLHELHHKHGHHREHPHNHGPRARDAWRHETGPPFKEKHKWHHRHHDPYTPPPSAFYPPFPAYFHGPPPPPPPHFPYGAPMPPHLMYHAPSYLHHDPRGRHGPPMPYDFPNERRSPEVHEKELYEKKRMHDDREFASSRGHSADFGPHGPHHPFGHHAYPGPHGPRDYGRPQVPQMLREPRDHSPYFMKDHAPHQFPGPHISHLPYEHAQKYDLGHEKRNNIGLDTPKSFEHEHYRSQGQFDRVRLTQHSPVNGFSDKPGVGSRTARTDVSGQQNQESSLKQDRTRDSGSHQAPPELIEYMDSCTPIGKESGSGRSNCRENPSSQSDDRSAQISNKSTRRNQQRNDSMSESTASSKSDASMDSSRSGDRCSDQGSGAKVGVRDYELARENTSVPPFAPEHATFLASKTVNAPDFTHESSKALGNTPWHRSFREDDLVENNLPSETTLLAAVDFYYDHLHPNHMLLPSKKDFLKWFSPSSESSIYHAILANVCARRKLPIDERELIWIEKALKFSDNLNDFGMLLCYTLCCRTSAVKDDLKKNAQFTTEVFNIVESNRYVEILRLKRGDLNRRKTYEKECILRVVWALWCGILLVRLNSGHPYSLPEDVAKRDSLRTMSFADLSSKLPLPLSSDGFERLDDTRRLTLEEFRDNKLDDMNFVTKAMSVLRDTLDKISMGSLVEEDLSIDSVFERSLSGSTYELKNNVVTLSRPHVKANFVLRFAKLTRGLHFVKDVMIFHYLIGSKSAEDGDDVSGIAPRTINYVKALSGSDLINIEQIESQVVAMSDFQWSCVLYSLRELAEMSKILFLHVGIQPEESERKIHVRYDRSPEVKDGSGQNDNGEHVLLEGSELLDWCSSLLIGVIPSFIVLGCFVKLNRHLGKVEVELLKSSPKKSVFIPVTSESDVTEVFDRKWLVTCFENVAYVLKARLQCGATAQTATVTNIHRVGHFMEEIVRRLG